MSRNNADDLERYRDMLDLPRPIEEKHPPMPIADRAAQFAPFAALTGYGELITETGRPVDQRAEPGEDDWEQLNAVLVRLQEDLPSRPEVSVTYFVPDKKKMGGAYRVKTGVVKKIDAVEERVRFEDGFSVAMDDIAGITVDPV